MSKKKQLQNMVPDETIINMIYYIRGHKVMLDRDLAEMYGVETKRLKEAVKRNIERFPEQYMFELTKNEDDSLRSQIATLKKGRGQHSKYFPYAFTEHGVLMVANVLKSKRAIKMSMRIIDVFIRMREMLSTHKDILLKLEHMEKQLSKNNKEIQYIFDVLKQLLHEPHKPMRRIGYRMKGDE
jgi:phage regulator Rha-like protein